jgi:hypothetical protein
MNSRWVRYSAVVDSHLPEGFTKLRIHAGGDFYFDVLTEAIPPHLRQIGSRVLLSLDAAGSTPSSAEEIRLLRKTAVLVEDPAKSSEQSSE